MSKIEIKIESLGGVTVAKSFAKQKDGTFNVDAYLAENNLQFPIVFLTFLQKNGFSQFNKEVVFESIDKVPTAYEDNSCPISIFYGWGKGTESIIENREVYLEQIPDYYFPFAEATPGDQLCINLENKKIYFWGHEQPPDKSIFLVANSFEEFIEKLKIRQEEKVDDDLEEEWFSDDF